MDGLEKGELVVVCVDAGAEEEAGVAAVDDLVVAELDKVGLVLLVARGDEAVDFALELDLFVVAVGGVPFGEAGFAPIRLLVLRWWFCLGEGSIVVCAQRRAWMGRRRKGLLSVLDEDEGEHGCRGRDGERATRVFGVVEREEQDGVEMEDE